MCRNPLTTPPATERPAGRKREAHVKIFRLMRERKVRKVTVIYVAAKEFDATEEFWRSGDVAIEQVVTKDGTQVANPEDELEEILGDELIEKILETSTRSLRKLSRTPDVHTHENTYDIIIDRKTRSVTVEYGRKPGSFKAYGH
jgi:hypothetical protein